MAVGGGNKGIRNNIIRSFFTQGPNKTSLDVRNSREWERVKPTIEQLDMSHDPIRQNIAKKIHNTVGSIEFPDEGFRITEENQNIPLFTRLLKNDRFVKAQNINDAYEVLKGNYYYRTFKGINLTIHSEKANNPNSYFLVDADRKPAVEYLKRFEYPLNNKLVSFSTCLQKHHGILNSSGTPWIIQKKFFDEDTPVFESCVIDATDGSNYVFAMQEGQQLFHVAYDLDVTGETFSVNKKGKFSSDKKYYIIGILNRDLQTKLEDSTESSDPLKVSKETQSERVSDANESATSATANSAKANHVSGRPQFKKVSNANESAASIPPPSLGGPQA